MVNKSKLRRLKLLFPQFEQLILSFWIVGTALLHTQILQADTGRGTFATAGVSLSALNYHQGKTVITPGASFSVELSAALTSKLNYSTRAELPLAFFLLPEDVGAPHTAQILKDQGLFVGHASLLLAAGRVQNEVRIQTREDLGAHPGFYNLVALNVGETAQNGSTGLIAGPLQVQVSNENVGQPLAQIIEFTSSRKAVVLGDESDVVFDGTVSIETQFSAREKEVLLHFCFLTGSGNCEALEVWNSASKDYSDSAATLKLPVNDIISTLYQVRLPKESTIAQEALAAGSPAHLRVFITDADGATTSFVSEQAEVGITLYPALVSNAGADTDFARDLKLRQAQARKILRRERRSGKLPRLDLTLSSNGDLVRTVDVDAALKKIITRAKGLVHTRFYNEPDTYSTPTDLTSTITGSRFNMPDGDFPWLKNIGVKADPPPVRYNGTGFPSINEFKRCIPFFCGPTSPTDAGKEPSESCIREFCGSTIQDISYGGDNPNLIDQEAGFDKNFTAGGFGARAGVSMQAKVFHDKAISDYVAASFESDAFFGVKVFDYSVPLFEASTQAVYSPTEIGNSMSQTEIKVLGKVVEREEKQSSGLSKSFSKTYGVDKSANVGIGPISVKVKVEAGGTGGITAAIEQIDVLRGIVGSLTPRASIGASASASVDIGIGSFGIEGNLTLIEDSVPLTATFNAGLDISQKVVAPQLNLNIKNVLDGPNGNIKLVLEVGISPLTTTYRVTLVSFSTGSFETPIYNKNITFAKVSYK